MLDFTLSSLLEGSAATAEEQTSRLSSKTASTLPRRSNNAETIKIFRNAIASKRFSHASRNFSTLNAKNALKSNRTWVSISCNAEDSKSLS